MKLLDLNVALFEPNTPELVEFLKIQDPDIVCLQEVVHAIDRNVKQELITKEPVDEALPNHLYSFFGPTYSLKHFIKKEFHGKANFDFEMGGFIQMGNYTKSKYPISFGQNIFVENNYSYITDFSNWPEVDYRSVLVTELDLGGKTLTVFNYHGIWTRDKQGNEKTLKACQQIYELALQAKGEVIICGDFNLFPDTESMQIFSKSFTSLIDTYNIKTTRPQSNELSGLPRNVVDFVWVSGGINVKNFEVIASSVSDHLPLVLDFEI